MTRSALGAAAVLVACVGLAQAGNAPRTEARADRPIDLTLEAVEGSSAPTPRLVRAAYLSEIHSGMAATTLSLEFEDPGDEDEGDADPSLRWRAELPPGVEVRSVSVDLGDGGRSVEHEVGPCSPAPVKSASASETTPEPPTPRERLLALRGRETRASAGVEGPVAPQDRGRCLRSELVLAGGKTSVVRLGLLAALDLDGARFKFALPPVRLALPAERGSERVGRESVPLAVGLTIHHPTPLVDARSPSDDVLIDFDRDRTIVEPVSGKIPGGRSFLFEYSIASPSDPTLAGFLRAGDADGHAVEAVFQPPRSPNEEAVRPKQVVFLVDTSGSMLREDKLDQARRAVSASLGKLRPADRFNVIEFGQRFTSFRPTPAVPSELQVEATRWLDGLVAAGGTRLLPALAAAFEQPDDPERHRLVVVVTDGMIHDEAEALALLEEKLGAARLFVVGTGQHTRQETLLRLAEFGRGAATFAGRPEQLETAVAEMFDSIANPLGWDLELELDGAEVEALLPSRLADLYAGRPVRVLAWVRGELPSTLELRMSTLEGERRFQVALPPPSPP